MKKLSIIVILSIIFNLLIIPYGFVNAEPEPETDSQSQSNTQQNEQQETQKETHQEIKKENQQETQTETQQSDKTENQTEDKEETKQNDPNPEYSGENDSPKNESPNKFNSRQKAETRKSDNANLSDLGITPNDFKGFKPSTYNYSVTVPNDVEKVSVYAKVQDSKSKISSGVGNHDLNVGANELQIIVTAENGNTQTYTINVTREESEKTETTTQEVSNDSDLKKLEIKGYKLTPSFSADVYEYKLDVNKDVNNLDIITEGLNDKVNIEIAGNTDLKER